MVECRSLVMKMEEAQMVSLKTGAKVRVMTKPRKKPVVCSSEFVYRERVLDGWSTYCWFTAGMINE